MKVPVKCRVSNELICKADVNDLKMGKAPGDEKLPAEFFKPSPVELLGTEWMMNVLIDQWSFRCIRR